MDRDSSANSIQAENGNGNANANANGGSSSSSSSMTERTPLLNPTTRDESTQENLIANQEEERTIFANELPFSRLALIMGAAWVGMFLGAIDSTIIATLAGPISSEFKSLSLFSWLASAYLISTAACQPVSGRLTDIFGRGPGLVFSNVFFAAGNLICGLSKDQHSMILGRIVAGIGGGGLMSISTFLASDLVPLRRRGIVQGIGNTFFGSGAMLGGVFGGLLNDHTKLGWRLAFFIQVPPALICAAMVFFLVKVPPKQSHRSYIARIDFPGVVLTISSLVLMLIGLNTGGNVVPWLHPLPLTTITLSVITFTGFIWWESRAKQPIIPVRLLTVRTVLAASLCCFVCTMVIMCGLFHVPLYLQALGNTPTTAALRIVPSPIGLSICSVSVGYFMKKTGRYLGMGITCLVSMIGGIFLFTLQSDQSPAWLTSVAFFFVGSGYGGMLTVTLLACIAAVEHSQQAVTTSITYLARSLGAALGVTLGSTVYQNILKARLWARFGDEPNAADVINYIRNDLDALNHLPEGWYNGVIQSFIEAFRGVWVTMLLLAVVGLLCISMMRQHILHNTLERA